MWEHAMKAAQGYYPEWTQGFWRKTREIYEKMGGELEETEELYE